MYSRLSYFLTALLISTSASAAFSQSAQSSSAFTLQVASFPDASQASVFAVGLKRAGEYPVLDTVEIQRRGYWTRVYVGLFDSENAARRYGVTLMAHGTIKEFLITRAGSLLALTRPRRVATGGSGSPNAVLSAMPKILMDKPTGSAPATNGGSSSGRRGETQPRGDGLALPQRLLRDQLNVSLPIVKAAALRLAPKVDTSLIPRSDPVHLAFRLVGGEARNSPIAPCAQGGLWLSGDTVEGLARLRWIAGDENTGLINLEADGRVRLDTRLIAKAAGLSEARVEDSLRALGYISANEGLLLLVQATQGRYRYLLHIGRRAPTLGKSVETTGSINLDNNVDSRINPYRKNGEKLDAERPPGGFDSLIGLNPAARWFNLRANCWVQAGEIVFHELAEAYAKLEFGLDYLDHGSRPGAHAKALERELRLKAQRPSLDIVMTAGSNRLLRTEEEIRLFYAEAAAGSNQR